MRTSILLLTTLVTLSTACSKKKDASSCKPLSVTTGGKPIPNLGHGLARLNKMGSDQSYEVDVFNHDKVTCEKYNDKHGRAIEPDEVSVRAFAGGEGLMGHGVGIGSHTQSGVTVDVVGDPPKAVGDTVKICVDNAKFKPAMGDLKDQEVVIDGLFEGKYCGEMVF